MTYKEIPRTSKGLLKLDPKLLKDVCLSVASMLPVERDKQEEASFEMFKTITLGWDKDGQDMESFSLPPERRLQRDKSSTLLSSLFCWLHSPSGYEFWEKINDSLLDLSLELNPYTWMGPTREVSRKISL